jgi:hypothetical protein
MTSDFEHAFLGAADLNTLLTQLPQAAQTMTNVNQAAQYIQTPQFQGQVQDIKTEVSDTATLLAALFTLSTIFAGVQCFIAVYNFRKGRQ